MAAATAMAIGSAVYSGYQAIDAADKKASHQRALDGLAKPVNVNVADGLQVSTLGANMRREEQGRVSASEVDALRGSGTRGIIGGIGAVDAQNKATEQSIAANLDEQQKNIDVMKADDNIRLQGIEEDRYKRDVAGLSSQINASNAEMNQGVANTMNAAASAASSLSTPEGSARREAWRASGGKGHKERKAFMDSHQKSDYATKSSATAPAVFNNVATGQTTQPAPIPSISGSAKVNTISGNINTTDEFIYDGNGNEIRNKNYKPIIVSSISRSKKSGISKNGDLY